MRIAVAPPDPLMYIRRRMNALSFVRKQVFSRLSQSEFAAIAGVSQATISRWETGELEPSRLQLSRIRDAARARGLLWNDTWFFDVPSSSRPLVVLPEARP